MRPPALLSLAVAALFCAGAGHAQTVPKPVPPVPGRAAPPASAASAPSPPASAGAPRQKAPSPSVTVIEDNAVRIEETRVRGQPQRIVVQSKVPGAKAYEILVAPGGGKDPSLDRGAVNQRAWSLFSF